MSLHTEIRAALADLKSSGDELSGTDDGTMVFLKTSGGDSVQVGTNTANKMAAIHNSIIDLLSATQHMVTALREIEIRLKQLNNAGPTSTPPM